MQLSDCNTDTHLWAERFDQELANLFEMQDEIVARLSSELGVQLIEAEARRAAKSPDLDSMDLYFRARALINRGSTAEYLRPAEALLERALRLDPNLEWRGQRSPHAAGMAEYRAQQGEDDHLGRGGGFRRVHHVHGARLSQWSLR